MEEISAVFLFLSIFDLPLFRPPLAYLILTLAHLGSKVKSLLSHRHHLNQVFQIPHSLARLSIVLFQRYSLEGVFLLPL